MKRFLIVFFALFIVLFSCSKQAETAVDTEPTLTEKTEAEVQVEQEVEPVFSVGVIYVNDVALYVEDENGKMKWATTGSIGETLTYLGTTKEATRTDNQKRNFFHVRYNDKEYWIQDYCFEPDTIAAFISEDDTVLYKSDALTAATNEIIPKYCIVAVYNDSLRDSNSKFLKIAAYCTELSSSWTVKEKFVKRSAVELNSKSVEAMILAQVAMDTKNDIVRKELFKNAIEMYTPYANEIQALSDLTEAQIKEEAFLKTITTESVNHTFKLLTGTSLFSIPTNSGEERELVSVAPGTSLTATQKYVVPNSTTGEVWYKVTYQGETGWVMSNEPDAETEE